MTVWRPFLNDQIPDCGVAACCNAMLLWKTADPTDADAKKADDRFSAADYASKVLWGWWERGIGGNKLGGFATIKPSQIDAAVKRFGCAFVVFDQFQGSAAQHAVLKTKDGYVSWGKVYPGPYLSSNVVQAFAIAPKFHPILIWWALTNNPRWFLFLAPLWWPQ